LLSENIFKFGQGQAVTGHAVSPVRSELNMESSSIGKHAYQTSCLYQWACNVPRFGGVTDAYIAVSSVFLARFSVAFADQ